MGCFPVDKTDRVIKRAAGDYRDFSLNTYGCRETCSNQETNFAVLQEGDICMCAFDICTFKTVSSKVFHNSDLVFLASVIIFFFSEKKGIVYCLIFFGIIFWSRFHCVFIVFAVFIVFSKSVFDYLL